MSNKNKNAAVRDNRRYKYGGLSIAFTLVFIALILVINVFLSSLSLSGSLTVDLTKEDFTSIGDETVRLLDELGKDLDITVTFMSPRDRFYDGNGQEHNGLKLEVVIRDLAEAYQKLYDGSGKQFCNKEFFDEHRTIFLYTPGHILEYEIISAFVYDDRHILNSFNFDVESERQEFFDECVNPTSFTKQVLEGATLDTDDKIITLSTCTSNDSERYLVIGKLVSDTRTYKISVSINNKSTTFFQFINLIEIICFEIHFSFCNG